MDDNNYKIDKIQLHQQQENRAFEKFEIIEKKCELHPISFLKETYNFEKIRNIKNDIDFSMTLAVCLSRICVLSGINSKVDVLNSNDITKAITNAYSDLSIEEVYKAFEFERYGHFESKTNHYQLFNAEYVCEVIKKYKKWKQDTRIINYINEPKKNLPEISESQKKEIVDKGIIRVFNEFKETGEIPEPCSHIFDELYERKIIRDGQTPGEQAYYQRKYSEAAVQIERELKSENTGSLHELRTIKEELDKIGQNNSDKVILRIKKLILIDLFTRLIDSNTHIIEKMQ